MAEPMTPERAAELLTSFATASNDAAGRETDYNLALRMGVDALRQVARDELVKVWSCPDCGFSFDAFHTDDPDGGYSCPVCEVGRLRDIQGLARTLAEKLGPVDMAALGGGIDEAWQQLTDMFDGTTPYASTVENLTERIAELERIEAAARDYRRAMFYLPDAEAIVDARHALWSSLGSDPEIGWVDPLKATLTRVAELEAAVRAWRGVRHVGNFTQITEAVQRLDQLVPEHNPGPDRDRDETGS